MKLKLAKTALLKYYSKPLREVFKQFRLGLTCFGFGIISVLMANAELEPSLQQEIIVLFGLFLTITGFLIAMLAQIRMLISRVIQFTRN